MTHKYLLSIDGGGLRGVIPISALAQLEQVTGRPARDSFSFVAGTSTGAIIAAAIAAGIPAQEILQLYLTSGKRVFTKRPWSLLQRIVLGSMYSTKRLHDVIGEGLGHARDWTLNDAPIDVLITAKRLADGMPWYFVRNHPCNSQRTGRLKLADCVTASTAEPTYFRPYRMPELPAQRPPRAEPIGELVGGGVGVAGNPVYQACVEAFYYSQDYHPEETTVISLGTGRALNHKRPTWIWPWLNWVLGELLRSPGEQQTEIVQRHFPQTRFYRIDVKLTRDISLDDVRALDELRKIGARFAATIDWPAILAGTDTHFLVGQGNTLPRQYSQDVSLRAAAGD